MTLNGTRSVAWMGDPDDLGGVLGDWDSDLMSGNCRRFFSRVLDYGNYEADLLSRIIQVAYPDQCTTEA